MPYDDPDETDPMTLTGVEIEVDDPASTREMGECFVEEYVRLGLSAEAILELFESGKFAGPTMVISQLGRETVRRMIDEQILLRGPRGVRIPVDRFPGGAIGLPVFEQ